MFRTTLILSAVILMSACSTNQVNTKSIFDRVPDLVGTRISLSGDNSFLVGDTYVSLYGITPLHFGQKCLDSESKIYSCGSQYFSFTRATLSKAKSVRCYLANDYQPSYIGNGTHVPMHCFVNGLNLNETLVAKGFALSYDPLYQVSQDLAQKTKSGVWIGKFMHPQEYAKFTENRIDANTELFKGNMVHKTDYPEKECTVKALNRSGGKVYLVPGDAMYNIAEVKTVLGDVVLCSEQEALEQGYRRSK